MECRFEMYIIVTIIVQIRYDTENRQSLEIIENQPMRSHEQLNHQPFQLVLPVKCQFDLYIKSTLAIESKYC